MNPKKEVSPQEREDQDVSTDVNGGNSAGHRLDLGSGAGIRLTSGASAPDPGR